VVVVGTVGAGVDLDVFDIILSSFRLLQGKKIEQKLDENL
jgi:hypothetical protein